jgi:hypothetical protein
VCRHRQQSRTTGVTSNGKAEGFDMGYLC